MGVPLGFAPWIVYWVLVGNAPFKVAALVALAVAGAALLVGLVRRAPGRTLDIGAVATFAVLAVCTVTYGQSFSQRWVLPLSDAGIFVTALTGALRGRPFVREFARIGQPAALVSSESFGTITSRLTWIWVAVFAGMTVSSSIPPVIRGDATLLDTTTPLVVVCYWVLPFALFGLAAVAARLLPDPLIARADDAPRKTTFVAYSEATIDELYYLAQQHANREVGAGQEAYDVKVGGLGTPLVGDDSRKSWPSTYKVREARR